MRWQLPQPYRDLDHTADVGIEVEGASAEEALARLVLGEAALLAGGGAVDVEREERVRIGPAPLAELAVAVLRELLFRFATQAVLVGSCEVVALDPARGVELVLGMGRRDPARHGEGVDLKAVTWHRARFERGSRGWCASVVFDV